MGCPTRFFLWEFQPLKMAQVPPRLPDYIPGGYLVKRRDAVAELSIMTMDNI